jgi:hypothetical protein
MKKSLFLAFFLLTLVISGISQTSMEEYNYITKGYKVQLESGLDMKKGYEFEDLNSHTAGIRTASLKKLVKINSGKRQIAAYMIVYQKEQSPKEYFCIPNPKSAEDVIAAYWTALYNGTGDSSAKLQLIIYLISNQLVW